MNTLNLVGNIARDLETKVVGDNMTIVKTAIAVKIKAIFLFSLHFPVDTIYPLGV